MRTEARRQWQEEVQSRTDLGQYKNRQRELDRADYLKGFRKGEELERRSRDGVSKGIIGLSSIGMSWAAVIGQRLGVGCCGTSLAVLMGPEA